MPLNLKVRGPTSTINLSVSPDLTYDEFKILLSQEFKFTNEQEYDLMNGFPPLILQASADALLKNILSNNDNIRLQLKEDSGKQLQGKPMINKVKSKSKSLSTGTTTSSEVASSIMNKSSSMSSSLSFGAKITDLSTLSSPKNKSNNTGSKRITDNDACGGEKSPKRTRHRSTDKITSEDDICEHLLNAINGGTTNINKVLRRVFRNAVGLQYNATKAIDRLNAGLSGLYTIQVSLEQRILGTGESTKMIVNFAKEAGSRSNHTEEVDLLPADVLVELLKIAYKTDQELLKPINLSKYSPRIFWSLIRRYGNDIHVTIKTLLATIGINICNVSLLGERKRELSEKAKANLEQHDQALAIASSMLKKSQRMKKNVYNNRKVEEDNDVLQANNKNNKSNNSNNNSSNINDGDDGDNVVKHDDVGVIASVPVDQHSRQILDFITAEIESSTSIDCIISPEFYLPLLNYLHVTNSSEMIVALASLECNSKVRNAVVDMKINTEILPNIKSRSSSSSDDGIHYNASGIVIFDPNASINSGGDSGIIINPNKKYSSILSLDTLDEWIGGAQYDIIHCIWRILCGCGSERLRKALERLRIKTPMEMMIWRNIPHALLEGLCAVDCDIKNIRYFWLYDDDDDLGDDDVRASSADDISSGASSSQLSVDKVRWMCDVCSVAMKAYPWTADYSLPYEVDGDNIKSSISGENGNDDNDDEEEEDYDEEDEDEDGVIQQWLYDQSHHPFITRRVRLIVDLQYWEDGTVIAFLPPDETEPIALWKVMR